jgi:tight adherence protein B
LVGGLGFPRWMVGRIRNRRLNKFLEEFPNAVDVIVRGVRAGLPVNECLSIIAREAKEPVATEFRRVIDAQQMGIPLSEAVGRLYENIPLTESNFFGIVIAIQQSAGGNLSEALGNLSNVLRDRKKMKHKISAMSAEAKASAGIIGALPFLVATLVYLTTPDYIKILFTDTTGNMILVCSGIWMGMGIMVMKKMISFDF